MAVNEFEYYYHKQAFEHAFKETDATILISRDGSVFKNTFDPEDMVVSGGGEVGPAGGAPDPVRINDVNTGAISNVVQYTRLHGQYMTRQIALDTAVSRDLDYLGSEIFDIERKAGETDAFYKRRIVNEIFAIKCSPIAIEDSMVDYADGVEVDDDISSGMFSDVSFANYYKEQDAPDLVRGAFAGTVGGLIYMYNIIFDNPKPEKVFEILKTLEDMTAAGVTYNIFVIKV
jgi:hypothetical protein